MKASPLILLFCFGFLLNSFGMQTPATNTNETNVITLTLRETAEVSGESFQLKDIIDPSSSSLSEITLGSVPALGKDQTFRRADLDVILHRLQPKSTWAWSGATQCVVTHPAIEISETEVTNLIETSLRNFANHEGEIHVLKILNYSKALIPKLNSSTEVELISPNATTRFGSVTLNVEYLDRPFLRRDIRFEWEWKRPIWVARRAQTAGRIQPDDFVLEKHNVLALGSETLPSENLPSELILLRSIAKGEPLLRSNVQVPIAVARGSVVTACVHSGALLVSMKAIALESGSVGQTIRVQNPESRKELYGLVTRESIVEVTP